MVYLKKISDPRGYFQVITPLYVRKQKNGLIVLCDSLSLAQGILSPEGDVIWQLADRASLGGEYEEVQIITEAEYCYFKELREQEEAGDPLDPPDPEDTEPQIPENVAPETILTRAELTEKVNDLEEAVDLLLSGVTEDE